MMKMNNEEKLTIVLLVIVVLGCALFLGAIAVKYVGVFADLARTPGGNSGYLYCSEENGTMAGAISYENLSAEYREPVRKSIRKDNDGVEINSTQYNYFSMGHYINYYGDIYDCNSVIQ